MLTYLSVKNFAILENIEVQFKDGFTVLTGETGAGKSLLIDAIGLLLGDRASSTVIRSGFDTCEITGLFTNIPQAVEEILSSLDIPYEDNECLIKRQITTSGTNVIKVNQQAITLADLRNITQYLADIHTQHDTKRLINPETYLKIIDYYNPDVQKALNNYQKTYREYKESYTHYNSLLSSKDHALEKQTILKAHIEEIEKHDLKANELEEIEEELTQLQNFDKIFKNVSSTYENLTEFEVPEKIFEAHRMLEELASFDEIYRSLSKRLESTYYELTDIRDTISYIRTDLDFNPERLDYLETREHSLKTLSRKYHKTIEELIEYKDVLYDELNQYENMDQSIDKAYQNVLTIFEALKKAALSVSDLRKKTAKEIEKNLIEVLKDLELKSVDFEIQFKSVSLKNPLEISVFNDQGVDYVDFYLSTNIGETKRPLSKVASGGELSRIMLALKEIFMRNMKVSLMIFDEIDTGVSGYVASQVALKMKDISKRAQVLSITHLPQVAAKADVHYKIFKSSDDNRTKAFIKELNMNERIEAIAEMISSEEVTEDARRSAESLLK